MKLTTAQKVLLVIICFGLSIVGFMIKLPPVFRHIDKEMHALFYFVAAAFLNVLFAGNNIIRHIVIFVILLLLSISIEYAQEYSNTLLRKRIHGRYDPEDVKANLMGLIAFSILWFIYIAGRWLYRSGQNERIQ
jgi:hypothetical protein